MEEAKKTTTKNDRATSLAELKEFAIVFGKKRQSLGLSQNQIAEKLKQIRSSPKLLSNDSSVLT